MKEEIKDIELELSKFPSSVLDEFKTAMNSMSSMIEEPYLSSWARQGVQIAQKTVRSWEAAAEYYKSSMDVSKFVSGADLLHWGQCGLNLCDQSPGLAVSFFKSSTGSRLQNLNSKKMSDWAELGSRLYKGTWKSSALASKFFESSGSILEDLTDKELREFGDFVELISRKSIDVATECLILSKDVLPSIDSNRSDFIKMVSSVAENNWREVKSCFEYAPRFIQSFEQSQRGRFINLSASIAKNNLPNLSLFLNETSRSLSGLDENFQSKFLDLAEQLLPISSEAVFAFLQNAPQLVNQITINQIEVWFNRGVELLNNNVEGGLAFFKIESATSEKVIDDLSSSVELEKVQGVLRIYCRALAGADIEIGNSAELAAKNIGWVSENHATTEGNVVYLPHISDYYDNKELNFGLFKVISTHQIAHIEFGSFEFDFEQESANFIDSRLPRESEAIAEHKSHVEIDITDDHQENSSQSVKKTYVTDMGRFFNLFPNRKLALDLFTVVEDGRLDNEIRNKYPGMSVLYKRIQQDSMEDRPDIEEMPLQEAMVEFLVRFSLQQFQGLPCPTAYIEEAKLLLQIFNKVLSDDTTVEDSAEATLRIYDLIAEIPNTELPEEDWSEIDTEIEEEISNEEMENLLQQMTANSSPDFGDLGESQDYESPPQVDFRGDFKPELSQLLEKMKLNQTDSQSSMGEGIEITEEMLQQMLADSAELELDAESGQFDEELSNFIQNLMKESQAPQNDQQKEGYAPIPHQDDEGESLTVQEEKSYVYDEWDFRAVDYRPRWCLVKEKPMAEGDTEFYQQTVSDYRQLMNQIKRQFEMLMPEAYRKIKHLPDGDDFDLDAVVESIIDKWAGESPSDKVHWRRNKIDRDVSVAFLLDMSASTAEAIDESRKNPDDWDAPDDPVEYMVWLRARRGAENKRSYKRIIDLEKESIVLLINALETIGDRYGIYGFSGYGRENVEYYVIKDLEEQFNERIKRRIDKVSPLHATRMGPAIRHAVSKLAKQDSRTKVLFLISDGRPQDRGYSREGVEKEYAVHDTRMALIEARHKGITPFCLTVDKSGHDYLKTMCQDMGYEILDDISSLPTRLPALYRKLTF